MSLNAVLFFILVKIISISYCSPRNFRNVAIHPNCLNSTYCFERGNDYPSDLIEYLVNKTELRKIDVATPEHRKTSHSILTPCDLRNSEKPIYQIRDINNKVRYVVQSTRFQQIIKVEWCINKGEITEDKGDYLIVKNLKMEYYTAYCRESYTNYRFLVLAEDGKSFESVRVKKIPICCRCEIYPTGKKIFLDEE